LILPILEAIYRGSRGSEQLLDSGGERWERLNLQSGRNSKTSYMGGEKDA